MRLWYRNKQDRTDRRFAWPLALGVGALAGGLSYLFNQPKKASKDLGTPPLDFTGYPVAHDLKDLILKAYKGEGVGPSKIGFGEDYVSRSTSPAIAQLEYGAPKAQREIQDLYAARGLGRGTAVVRDMGEVASQRERDINQLLSNAYLTNEQQKKSDEKQKAAEAESWRNLGLNFAQAQTGQGNYVAQDAAQRAMYQSGVDQNYDAAQKNNLNASIATGLSTFGGFGGGTNPINATTGSLNQPLYGGAPAQTPGYNAPAPSPFLGGGSNEQFQQFLKFLTGRK